MLVFGYCAYKLPQMSTRRLKDASPPIDKFAFNDKSEFKSTEPPIIADAGMLLIGYCAYKLPQMSTRPLNDASFLTYNLLLKEPSPDTTSLPFNDISFVITTS